MKGSLKSLSNQREREKNQPNEEKNNKQSDSVSVHKDETK